MINHVQVLLNCDHGIQQHSHTAWRMIKRLVSTPLTQSARLMRLDTCLHVPGICAVSVQAACVATITRLYLSAWTDCQKRAPTCAVMHSEGPQQ